MASPFEILEVDPDADEAEIQRAYRRRVKETHPDQGGSREAFLAVKRAYETLSGDRPNNGDLDDVVARAARGDPTAAGDAESDDEAGDAESEEASDDESDGPADPTGVRVEYLNYDVVADYGWSLDDEDLFERAAEADLDPGDYGRFVAPEDEFILAAAEGCGFSWPYACRGGACANCAVAVVEGAVEMPGDHILSDEMLDRGIRLSCISKAMTDELKLVYNVKHLPDLDDLRLPPHPFDRTRASD